MNAAPTPAPPTPAPPAAGYRGRFAPSPTGPLHFGSLVAALGSWLMARRAGGEWWVRIEDVDRQREVPGAAARQLATLAAFGMVSDGPVVRQSERGDRYATALARLVEQGDAFPCRCSRGDLAESHGIHRACVEHPSGVRTWRLRVSDRVVGFEDRWRGHFEQNLLADVGDVVLKRADGNWAYQLAVVVDDADQGITDIVRGADLLDSTPRQRYLQERLGLAHIRYAHLPLLLDEEGRKLGKSSGSLALDEGDPLPALRAAFASLGQDQSRLPTRGPIAGVLLTAITEFDPDRVPHHDFPVRLSTAANA